MANDKGNQKGAQAHAEGQHGEKAHKAFLESIQTGRGDNANEQVAQEGSPFGENESDGRHRLREDREQHDEAEKNSELGRRDTEQGPRR